MGNSGKSDKPECINRSHYVVVERLPTGLLDRLKATAKAAAALWLAAPRWRDDKAP